jgi:hypothetical protein
MAAGTVVGCWRNAPENVPGSLHASYKAGKYAGGGNHLWILQDDGVYALYAHAAPGTIPGAMCPNNATLFTGTRAPCCGSPDIDPAVTVTSGGRVIRGQFLGLIGNSGASESGPHLHVHMEKDGNPVIMPFDRGLTTPFATGKASLGGPWTRLAGNAMPKARILIWPPNSIGNYTVNDVKAVDFQRRFDHLADSGMLPDIITCKDNGQTYTFTWIPAEGAWVAHYGMSAEDAADKHALYTSQGFTRTSSYTCGKVSVAVWRK